MRAAVVDHAAQPVRNLCPVPAPANFGGSGWAALGAISVASAPWGRPAVGSVGNGNSTPYIFARPSSRAHKAGETVCGRVKLHCTLPNAAIRLVLHVRSTNRYFSSTVNQRATGTTQDLVTPAVMLDQDVAANDLDVSVVWWDPDVRVPATAGHTMTVGDCLIQSGATTPTPFGDGDTPGWRWTGAAGASESVGYPYTLESIAGQPLAAVDLATPSSAALTLGAYEGRTIYVVHDSLNTDQATGTLAAISTMGGAYSAGSVLVRGGPSGTDRFEGRFEAIAGSAVTFAAVPGSRTPGRHVSNVSISGGLTALITETDSLTSGARTVTSPASGLATADTRLWLGPVNNSESPIVALAYRSQHNEITRRRVMAWLARRYGAPIPTGY